MKTAAQWRGVWKKDVYNARCDAAALHAESRGTGGGSLLGPRGRILSLVGRASAIGVCPPFFEPDEEKESAADRGAGDSASCAASPAPIDALVARLIDALVLNPMCLSAQRLGQAA
ncbi:uncharacterized protein LOC142566973 [Dermacentor variabilis]|uniref:uncharacterized protein LOC142566973 n=1 Tax=Dermacentor variabilis TaxID=34621 RepID=UPI003F5BE457